MTDKIRVALAQINSTVGDLAGNAIKIRSASDNAKSYGADLILFPELALTGYPPQDLLISPFVHPADAIIRSIVWPAISAVSQR